MATRSRSCTTVWLNASGFGALIVPRQSRRSARARSSSREIWLSAKMVTVQVRDVDRYKRTVAEIILPDGRNLNRELVRAGLAWWYQRYARHGAVLADLEVEA